MALATGKLSVHSQKLRWTLFLRLKIQLKGEKTTKGKTDSLMIWLAGWNPHVMKNER